MKKSFFKKLSFVLALAMIVSTIAPAAGAFAAAKPALSVTGKYLLLGESGQSSYDFNFKKSTVVKGSKYAWSSSKTSVATVNSVGLVKAKKAGTSYIYCKVTKAGKTLTTAKAKVVVLNNMKTAAITDPGTVGVNKATNLALTYTTFSGATTGSTSYVAWSVSGAGATVTDKGVFTATAPGTFTVTAKAYSTKTTTAVKATADLTITVKPSIVETKQVDQDSFSVKFDCDMSKSDIKTAAVLNQVIAGKPISTGAEKIKAVTYSTDGTTATIDTYASFSSEGSYVFSYAGLTSNFTAAKKSLANIKGLAFADFNVTIGAGKDMVQYVTAYDANGVVIYTGSELASYLTFTYGGTAGKGAVSSTNAYIYAAGDAAKMTAKFYGYVYDDVTKAYVLISVEDDAVATGVNTDSSVVKTALAYATPLTTDTTASKNLTFGATTSVAVNDACKIVAKYTKADATSSTVYNTDSGETSRLTFKTTDSDKLLVNGNTMLPLAVGKVTVLVYETAVSTTAVIGSFDVDIVAARAFASATPEAQSFSVSNAAGVGSGTLVINVLDTLGAKATVTSATPSPTLSASSAYVTAPVVSAAITDKGKITITANGAGASVGSYTYKMTVNALGSSKDVYFNLNVVDGSSTSASTPVLYKVELGTASVDLNGVSKAAVSVAVYGYNAAGVKVNTLATGAYTLEVKDGNNNNAALAWTSGSIPVVDSNGTAGSYVTADALSTYTITAKANANAVSQGGITVATNAILNAATLIVKDTTVATVGLENYTVSYAAGSLDQVSEVAIKAFGYTLDGNTYTDSTEAGLIQKIEYSIGSSAFVTTAGAESVVAGNDVRVANIWVKKLLASGEYASYKVPVNITIAVR